MITEKRIREFIKEFHLASDTKDFSNVFSMIHPSAIFRFNVDEKLKIMLEHLSR